MTVKLLQVSYSHERVARLVRLLVRLSGDINVEEVWLLAGQCLGELAGSVDPSAIAQAFATPIHNRINSAPLVCSSVIYD